MNIKALLFDSFCTFELNLERLIFYIEDFILKNIYKYQNLKVLKCSNGIQQNIFFKKF